jgi:hypothetical protein
MVFTLLVHCSSLLADSPAKPRTYKQLSADGRYVFVMIPPGTLEEELRRWNAGFGAKVLAIRTEYATSGLYRSDDSSTPLWTVDWYSFQVDVASDGKHLIRHGPWASSTNQEAITFFANGKPLRNYQIKDLVDVRFFLPHSVSHFQWEEVGILDDATLRYTLDTKDGNSFVFDVATGQIISETRGARVRLWAIPCAMIVLITGAVLWKRRK